MEKQIFYIFNALLLPDTDYYLLLYQENLQQCPSYPLSFHDKVQGTEKALLIGKIFMTVSHKTETFYLFFSRDMLDGK